MSKFDFDLLTIGAGSGGVAASRRAASYGVRVGICEGGRIGGTCVIRGCIPKKLLMYGAKFQETFEDAAPFGWTFEKPRFLWETLLKNKNDEITRLSGVYAQKLEDSGVTLLRGYGRLLDPHTVEIDSRRYTAERILIASGARPTKLNIPGAAQALTSNEVLDWPELPVSLIVLGGGYIAVELASIFNALGVRVTVAIRGRHILNGFDDDIRVFLEDRLKSRGVVVENGFSPSRIEYQEREARAYSVDGRYVSGEKILMATGRRPDVRAFDALGLDMTPKGAIQVDAWSRTSVENIYAIGDVTDRACLTPVAIAEGRAFVESMYNDNPTAIDYRVIPTAVFSLPPLATLGLSESQARQLYDPVDIYRTRFRPLKHTLSGKEDPIFLKMVVDRESDRMVGCHMVGEDSPEIIQGLAIAMTRGATKSDFDRTMALHPSTAEEFVTLYA